ncbi:MAG TPA: methyltransferase domain-containing protein [Elusimicrobiota bacterium]|nr:methyltransferase domain-containing protein [Elusimicrobiota bacterium]
MNGRLLPHLMCPTCRSSRNPLSLSAGTEERVNGRWTEILSGEIRCGGCRNSFKIDRGIPDLLPAPSETIRREQAGIQTMYDNIQDADYDRTLLQQPWIHDPRHPEHWLSIAALFDQAAALLVQLDDDKNRSDLTLIDLGAGSCWSTAQFSKMGYHCAALDISPHPRAGLGAAETRFNASLPYFDRILASMDVIPFRDHSVDRVITMDSVHHASDLAATAREIFRVLRPGGFYIAAAEPVRGILKNRGIGKTEIEQYGWNEHSYSRGEYKGIFSTAGFDTRILFPASIGSRIKSGIKSQKLSNRILGGIARYVWSYGPSHRLLTGPLFAPLQVLFGLPLILLAKKPA